MASSTRPARPVSVAQVLLLVALLLVPASLSALSPAPASAAGQMTVDQWVANTRGRSIEWNHDAYLYQCVDLVQDYLDKVYGINANGWGNAVDYAGGHSPGGANLAVRGFTWSGDTNPATFQNGDILVWQQSAASDIGAAGHIGIWYAGKIYDQNDGRHSPASTANYSTPFFAGGLLGRWRKQPANVDPVGAFDAVSSPAPGQIAVRGWAFDPDAKTTSLDIHVYVGGPAGSSQATGYDVGAAASSRPDVGAAYPGVGDNHGYDAVVASRGGSIPVYVYAINAPGTPGGNVLLGAKDVTVADPNPTGSFDGLSSPQGGELRVTGWTLDPNDVTQALNFHVYVGGPAGDPNAEGHAFGPANAYRPDVDATFPGVGEHHGIDWSFPTTKTGVQPVYLYAINIGAGDNVLIGSKTVDVGQGPPSIAASVAPAVRGRAVVGRVLRARPGLWTVDDITLQYQWLRAGHVITDATQPTYRLTRADRGHRVRVRVSADREGYVSGLSTSSATRRVR